MGTARSVRLAFPAAGVRELRLRPLRGADEAALSGGTPLSRAARLAEACAEGVPAGELAAGDLNRVMMAVHALNFSGRAEAVARCPDPGCGAEMDVELDFEAMLAASDGPGAEDVEAAVILDGRPHVARLRVLRVADLEAALACGDAEAGRRALIGRALTGLEAEDGGEPAGTERLLDDPAACDAVEAALTAADGFARLSVRGACPACGQETALAFEPRDFVLARLQGPGRLLDEVDAIARAITGARGRSCRCPWRGGRPTWRASPRGRVRERAGRPAARRGRRTSGGDAAGGTAPAQPLRDRGRGGGGDA